VQDAPAAISGASVATAVATIVLSVDVVVVNFVVVLCVMLVLVAEVDGNVVTGSSWVPSPKQTARKSLQQRSLI
jgi:hypothetical protein